MDETKYGKYIITEVTTDIFLAPGEPAPEREDSVVLNFDDTMFKGAFVAQVGWITPADITSKKPVGPHNHDFDEILGQFGTDINNPHDLGGELEVWLGGEKHIITKSHVIFIPKGLEHGPLTFKRLDRPVIGFNIGAAQKYSGKKNQ
jgi:hypothetical protein